MVKIAMLITFKEGTVSFQNRSFSFHSETNHFSLDIANEKQVPIFFSDVKIMYAVI